MSCTSNFVYRHKRLRCDGYVCLIRNTILASILVDQPLTCVGWFLKNAVAVVLHLEIAFLIKQIIHGLLTRYSGASLGAQAATIFSGGLVPVFATTRLKGPGSYWPVALIVVVMCAVTMASVLLAAETSQKDIRPKPEVRLVQA
jgi:hypothetical protein